ncbi:hypothetical protein NPIL_136551 [Nephila pilipes]|uniref:Reverse transcriptase domain-containing protein n=1 Tax=Nephila pilipes TaxID=299642 RepID=A0A8X6TND3_NEPPI|nr:hypothetical protein NPIL_136551 [Nephila pilipes]
MAWLDLENAFGSVPINSLSRPSSMRRNRRVINNSQFLVVGTPILNIKDQVVYKYLGVHVGLNYRQDNCSFFQENAKNVKLVAGSPLAPWQKLTAISAHILARAEFLCSNSHIQKKDVAELDKTLIYTVRAGSLYLMLGPSWIYMRCPTRIDFWRRTTLSRPVSPLQACRVLSGRSSVIPPQTNVQTCSTVRKLSSLGSQGTFQPNGPVLGTLQIVSRNL